MGGWKPSMPPGPPRRMSLPAFDTRPRSSTDSSLTLAGRRHAILPGVGEAAVDAGDGSKGGLAAEQGSSELRSRSESSFVSFCGLKPLHTRLAGSFVMPRQAQNNVRAGPRVWLAGWQCSVAKATGGVPPTQACPALLQVIKLLKLPRERTVLVLRVGGGYLIIPKDGAGAELVEDSELDKARQNRGYTPRLEPIVRRPCCHGVPSVPRLATMVQASIHLSFFFSYSPATRRRCRSSNSATARSWRCLTRKGEIARPSFSWAPDSVLAPLLTNLLGNDANVLFLYLLLTNNFIIKGMQSEWHRQHRPRRSMTIMLRR